MISSLPGHWITPRSSLPLSREAVAQTPCCPGPGTPGRSTIVLGIPSIPDRSEWEGSEGHDRETRTGCTRGFAYLCLRHLGAGPRQGPRAPFARGRAHRREARRALASASHAGRLSTPTDRARETAAHDPESEG